LQPVLGKTDLVEKMAPVNSHFASLTFRVASEIWFEDQKPQWKESTVDSYKKYIGRLNKHFAHLRLEEIEIQHLREYQNINSTPGTDGRPRLVPSSINHDLNTLLQVLARAGLSEGITRFYKPLVLPRWTPPRILSEREEDRFFEVAASNPGFSMAYWISSLTNNTSASGSELRKVQLKHVCLDSAPPLLYVPSESVRNEYGARVIPLNDRGVIQMKRIVERAHSLGSTEREHYLCPFRVASGKYDPTRPASAWFIYKQWNKLVDAALAAGAINFRIKPFHLRYNVVAKMLRAGAPEQTVMSIAGHVRRQMLEQFSRQRLEEKARALEMINPVRKRKE
jgi:Phage integrase, N-terminal SAM-like domain/Phage integrase family